MTGNGKGAAREASATDKTRTTGRRDFVRGAALGAGAGLVLGAYGVKLAASISAGVAIKPKGFSRARPIDGDTELPAKVDVAVIGGGNVGTATALALAERGVSVALFEKGVVAGEASGRSGGIIEATLTAPEKMELIEYSKQRWLKLNQITGEETTFAQHGVATLFEDQEGVEGASAWIESVKDLPNGGARMLTAAESAALAPGATVKLAGGLLCATDGTAESANVAPAMALGARKLGAKIYQFCAVRGIERTNGAVSGVITEKGRVGASAVVLAGGLWSPMLGNDLGLKLPMVQNFANVISLHPFAGPADKTTVSIMGRKIVGWRPQFDGGYIVYEFIGVAPIIPTGVRHYFDLRPAMQELGDATAPRFNLRTFWRWRDRAPTPLDRPGPFEETRIYEPEMQVEAADREIVQVQKTMPVFERGSVRERWCGAMEMCIDNMPILSTIDSIRGLVVGTGCFYGLTMGPGVGLVLADLATGAKPAIDVKPFRYSRFTDGTPYRFHE
jgi:glycine/D-amino acid oxidase-like deaminating enzyme